MAFQFAKGVPTIRRLGPPSNHREKHLVTSGCLFNNDGGRDEHDHGLQRVTGELVHGKLLWVVNVVVAETIEVVRKQILFVRFTVFGGETRGDEIRDVKKWTADANGCLLYTSRCV